ncbi:MAG: sigma-70 family RNA polymerase sigma factor [Clostridiales bacterium]|nr:sigma-70 family RNA polymerase sigma factor [Clostridiales bacterium]
MSIYAKEVNAYLSAIKHGDNSKFKPLYELIASRILGVARYYLVDRSYCEDVTSEVFQKIYLYINSYDESKDGYSWICRITRNIAFNFNNKVSQNPDNIESDSVLQEIVLMEDTDKRLDILRAIDKLDPESREIVYLYYYLQNTYQEIGDKLHISKVAVKKKIDKILLKLKKYIINY